MTEQRTRHSGQAEPLPERTGYLALLTLAPAIWMGHFLLTYVTAAVWCARFAGPGESLDPVRNAVMWYTAVALAGIVASGWSGFNRHRLGGSAVPHDQDTPEDRHRFLGFATLLLAGLSAVATIFVATAPAWFRAC